MHDFLTRQTASLFRQFTFGMLVAAVETAHQQSGPEHGSMSLQLSRPTRRPGYGTLGRPIDLKSNFFQLLAIPDHRIHHYFF